MGSSGIDLGRRVELRQKGGALSSEEASELYHDPDAPPEDESDNRISKKACESMNEYLEQHGPVATMEHFGVTQHTVEYHCERYDFRQCDHDNYDFGFDARRCNVARSMAKEGCSLREIGEFMGFHHSTVDYHVRGECACDATVGPHGPDDPNDPPEVEPGWAHR